MTAPLVSVLLMAYNQDLTVRNAIEGVLQQTYSPLELVISDDCSTDGTYTVMEDVVAAYAGPHRIVLNRNPKNFGIGAHFNRLVELSSGELMFVAAGDDISMPHRCQQVVEAWLASGKRADLVATAMTDMDQNEVDCGEIYQSNLITYHSAADWLAKPPYVVGAAHAWTRRLFDQFGPLPSDLVAEDQVMTFRAIVSGGALTLNQVLVRYRRGGASSRQGGSTAADVSRRLQRHSRHARAELRQLLLDAQKAQQLESVKATLEARLARENFVHDIFASSSRTEQLRIFFGAHQVMLSTRIRVAVYAMAPLMLGPFFYVKRLIRKHSDENH